MPQHPGLQSPPDFLLSVIIPVFNERITVRQLLDRVRAVPIRKEIVLVDDCSTDGTTEVVRAIGAAAEAAPDPMNRIRVFFHRQNAGKGAAVRTGIAQVAGSVTIVQDADLEYDPSEYPRLIDPIVNSDADVVYGSRFTGSPRRVLFFRHTLGNKLLTLLSNLATDLNLTDMETCYKVFRTDVIRRLHLTSNRFGIEPEITAKIAKLGCRVYEVPISYRGREYWEGKKIGWKDGFAAVWTILKYMFVDELEDEHSGYKTLKRLRAARRYNEWVWSLCAEWVGDRVLEVGSGIGTITSFMRNRERVVATDSDPHHLEVLHRTLDRFPNIDVRATDWENPAEIAHLHDERFDTILCLNVLEHIERDEEALATFAGLLPAGGRLVLQVPAMRSLYGEIDRAVGHYRRYDREELVARLERAGFRVRQAFYFNLPGILAWWLNARVLRRKTVPGVQVRFANLLVPWLRLERHFELRRGMGLVAVGEKIGA
ncbi:bifunctional glycosyltransferase/class I SAM-dependent methyltransferase [Candidatus Binatia bacterium]|nr:bifunctional glycosyltransferase/class I SAM-dependent methyltransferase [Candidatus Binatia bacterium]